MKSIEWEAPHQQRKFKRQERLVKARVDRQLAIAFQQWADESELTHSELLRRVVRDAIRERKAA